MASVDDLRCLNGVPMSVSRWRKMVAPGVELTSIRFAGRQFAVFYLPRPESGLG